VQLIEASHTDRQTTLVVRADGAVHDSAWTVESLSLEDLVLAYMGRAASTELGHRPASQDQP
jgi:ABC-2 type transport system ATP-binding protein